VAVAFIGRRRRRLPDISSVGDTALVVDFVVRVMLRFVDSRIYLWGNGAVVVV
jgi:hypothetical protein